MEDKKGSREFLLKCLHTLPEYRDWDFAMKALKHKNNSITYYLTFFNLPRPAATATAATAATATA